MIIFEQTDPNSEWIIVHNLGASPTVSVSSFYQGAEQMLYPKTVEQVDDNTVKITFSVATSGVAVVREGTFEYIQETPSATWTVVHNLDCSPVIQVYIDYDGKLQRAMPMSIVFDDAQQLTVRFSSPRTGKAVLH